MAKCPKCGEELVDFLFSSGHCPNSCDKGDTPLETPEETTPGYDKGIYQECKDRKEQRRKMLESLANANKAMWQFVGAVKQLMLDINTVIVAFKGFVNTDIINEYMMPKSLNPGDIKMTIRNEQLVDYYKWHTGIHYGNYDLYKHKDEDLYMILDETFNIVDRVIMTYLGKCCCGSDILQIISNHKYYYVDCAECGIHGRCANTVQEAMDEWEKLYNRYLKYSLMNEEKDGTDHPKDAEYYEEWYRQEYVCDFSHKSNDDRKEVEREIIESFKTPTWIINPNDRTNE